MAYWIAVRGNPFPAGGHRADALERLSDLYALYDVFIWILSEFLASDYAAACPRAHRLGITLSPATKVPAMVARARPSGRTG